MKKTIDTLVEDIYQIFDGNHTFTENAEALFAEKFGKQVVARIAPENQPPSSLRMSNIGTPCERKLYYHVNTPEVGEPLAPEVKMKFIFGDMYEEFILFLAEQAGHTVEGLQDQQDLFGVKGHRDAVIDGMLVDVKSASPYSFDKFKEGLVPENDAFGYIKQLQAYLSAAQNDPLVEYKDRAAFLVVNKVTGKMCLDVHGFKDLPWDQIVEHKRKMLSRGAPPRRAFQEEPHQKSGNQKLGVNCSYCEFKKHCWPGVRTFLYGKFPVHLTKVVREPAVPEI